MNGVARAVIEGVTLGALGLNAWHHVGWPLAMRLARRGGRGPSVPPVPADAALPDMVVVMPAYNEADHIAAKLRNLAALDYPMDRLRVVIACDGCRDATVSVATETLAEPECARLRVTVIDHGVNRGKVAVLNETIASVAGPIVVLTDVSAMLSTDALRRAAAHFEDPGLGAVGGTYRLIKPGSAGEAGYWRYQVAVKRGEAAMGAPLGLHGAFYALRRAAWAPLPPDTINDDFILPMEILGRGWRVAYDESIVAWEAEVADLGLDQRRRRRIAAGNAQQLFRLLWLLHPRFGGVALAFASGKALRVLAPFLFAVSLLGALVLAPGSMLFAGLAALQILALIAAAAGAMVGEAGPRPLTLARYVAAGHLASAIGVIRYVTRRDRAPWRSAGAAGSLHPGALHHGSASSDPGH
jgi:cellulose synthase/poly-beta-1,6-N-acetylglucosamine synthase-like glycosyltransferase